MLPGKVKADALRKALKNLPRRMDRLKGELHQHKRRRANLEACLERAKARQKFSSIAFGTKALFVDRNPIWH